MDAKTDYTPIDGSECDCSHLPERLSCPCGKHYIWPHNLKSTRPVHYKGEHWAPLCLNQHLIGELAECKRVGRALVLGSDVDDDALVDWAGATQ